MNIGYNFEPQNLDQVLLLEINERVTDLIVSMEQGLETEDISLEILKHDKKSLESLSKDFNSGYEQLAPNLISKIDYILESKKEE